MKQSLSLGYKVGEWKSNRIGGDYTINAMKVSATVINSLVYTVTIL